MKKIFTMIVSIVLLATMVVGGTLATELLSPVDFKNFEKQAVLIAQDVTVSELIPPYSDYTVSVTNKSSDTVYVRTLFAFEVLSDQQGTYLQFDENAIQPVMEQVGAQQIQLRIEKDKKQYDVYECYYSIEANDTVNCLQGFTFGENVRENSFTDGQYCIMAFSQAIMAENESENDIAVSEKMKQLFGTVTSNNHPWLSSTESTEKMINTQTNIDVQ